MAIELPKTKRKPGSKITALLYGTPGIGKTTFASNAPTPLILATEPGTTHLECYDIRIKNWSQLLEAYQLLAKGNHEFESVIIDTVDNAYGYCEESFCKRNEITHPADMGYGKGFAMVKNEFYRAMLAFSQLPLNFILISHVKELMQGEEKLGKVGCTLQGKVAESIYGLVDCIFLCTTEIKEGKDGKKLQRRIMRTRPSTKWIAKDRTGRLPDALELDYSKFQDYIFGSKPTEGPKTTNKPESASE